MTARSDVLTANANFYEAFRSANYRRMEQLWSRRRRVSCVHPGWPVLSSRQDVMASWYQVMVVSDPPAVFPHDPQVFVQKRVAMVVCEEELGGARMIATNIFVLEDGEWLMTQHAASPMPVTARDERGGGRAQGSA